MTRSVRPEVPCKATARIDLPPLEEPIPEQAQQHETGSTLQDTPRTAVLGRRGFICAAATGAIALVPLLSCGDENGAGAVGVGGSGGSEGGDGTGGIDGVNPGDAGLKGEEGGAPGKDASDSGSDATSPEAEGGSSDADADSTADSDAGACVSVKDFGAKGDGKTEDDKAIADALDACSAGQTLCFPAGTYFVATYVLCKEGVNMAGEGDGREGGSTSWIQGQVRTAPYVNFNNLKMGRELPTQYFGFGRTATHHMACIRCTFTGGPTNGGVIAYIGVDCYNILFQDCIIEGDPANHERNGVALVNNGRADAQIHDVEFKNCVFKSGGRIGFEITSRCATEDGGVVDYEYPIRNVNLINCRFEPMGASAISWGMTNPNMGGVGSAILTDGYSAITGCVVEDAGVYAETTYGKHGIELAGPIHMTVTGNSVGGSHVRTMLSMTNGSGLKWWDGYGLSSQNVIDNNVFDGRGSSGSMIRINGSCDWTFSNNEVYSRDANHIHNCTGGTLSGNHFYAVAADALSPSTVNKALWVQATDALVYTDNLFSSAVDVGIVQCRSDFNDSTHHSTNNWFGKLGHTNTYEGGGAHNVWIVAGSTVHPESQDSGLYQP